MLIKDRHQQLCEEEHDTQMSLTEEHLFSSLLYVR